MPPIIADLEPSDSAEEHLYTHNLYVEDAYEVLDESRYKVFPDPGHSDRVKMIGPDRSGRLLTIIIMRPEKEQSARIVTGWPSDAEESALYSKPGGSQYA